MAVASVPSLWVRRAKDVELFNLLDIKYEACWNRWSPLGSNQVICCRIVFLLILLSNLGL